MKRKIVVKVSMSGNKARSKALQTVTKIEGVMSAAIEGPEKDKVVVVGEDIDTVQLLDNLRKKFGYAHIATVQEIRPPVTIRHDQDNVIYHSQSTFPHYPPPYTPPFYLLHH